MITGAKTKPERLLARPHSPYCMFIKAVYVEKERNHMAMVFLEKGREGVRKAKLRNRSPALYTHI